MVIVAIRSCARGPSVGCRQNNPPAASCRCSVPDTPPWCVTRRTALLLAVRLSPAPATIFRESARVVRVGRGRSPGRGGGAWCAATASLGCRSRPAPPDVAAPHPPPRHAVQSLYNSPRLPRPRTVNYNVNIYSQPNCNAQVEWCHLRSTRQQSGVGSCLDRHHPALGASSRLDHPSPIMTLRRTMHSHIEWLPTLSISRRSPPTLVANRALLRSHHRIFLSALDAPNDITVPASYIAFTISSPSCFPCWSHPANRPPLTVDFKRY